MTNSRLTLRSGSMRVLHFNTLLRFLSIFICFSTSSQALEITRDHDRLLLSDQSCELVQNAILALSKWEPSIQKSCAVFVNRSGDVLCRADVTSCVPESVRPIFGELPRFSGPNCWNLSLVMSGILPSFRMTNIKEAANYLPSPLCRKLGANEPKEPGDIGALWLYEENLLADDGHAYVVINDEISFYKAGTDASRPLMFASTEKTFRYFEKHMKKTCQFDRVKPKDCKIIRETYRCQSLDGFLKNGAALSEGLSLIMSKYDLFERHLQDRTYGRERISQEKNANFIQFLREANLYLKNQGDAGLRVTGDDKAAVVLRNLWWRLDALRDQLVYLGDPFVNDIVDERNDFLREIQRINPEFKETRTFMHVVGSK